jgi:hypothetical protein
MAQTSEINFRALFRYDSESGCLIRISTGKPAGIYFKAKRKAGKPVERPYGFVDVGPRRYAAHRVVWAVVHGAWPTADLDHINRDTRDNRIENLRLASPKENTRNKTKARNNTSGYNGIDYNNGGWRVRVGSVFGGRYDSLELALKVRSLLYRELGYTDDHGS